MEGNYLIDREAYVFIVQESSHVVTILGYPASHIAKLG